MPETPKKEIVDEKELSTQAKEEKSAWEKDQKHRQYYYDDAHGYEDYKDDEAEDD